MTKTYEDILTEQHALNEQRAGAIDRGEHEILDELQDELDNDKSAILGRRIKEVTVGRDGVVIDHEVVEHEAAEGHEASGPYTGGRR